MNSTINDIVEKIFTCSCGCKTKNIKQHKKSIRHKYIQRKVDMVNTVQIDNNDDIITDDFIIFIPLRRQKIKKMKVKAPSQSATPGLRAVLEKHIHDISCIIDFD